MCFADNKSFFDVGLLCVVDRWNQFFSTLGSTISFRSESDKSDIVDCCVVDRWNQFFSTLGAFSWAPILGLLLLGLLLLFNDTVMIGKKQEISKS
jgi:hypothetical protein